MPLLGAEVEHRRAMAIDAGRTRVGDERFGEPRLAHARIGAKERDRARSRRPCTLEQRREPLPLGIASDQRLRDPRGRSQRDESKRAYVVADAAHRDRRQRHEVGERGRRRLHVPRHDRLAGRGELGQARGEIDGVARDRIAAVHGAPRLGGDHFTARDADVRAERALLVARQRRHRLVDRDGDTQRALHVVAMRDGRAEHRHHRVADVLVDAAPGALDDRVGELEEARQQPMRILRVEAPRKARVAGKVGEEDRDLAPLAGRGTRCPRGDGRDNPRSALRAEARAGREIGGTFRAARRCVVHGASGGRRRPFCRTLMAIGVNWPHARGPSCAIHAGR